MYQSNFKSKFNRLKSLYDNVIYTFVEIFTNRIQALHYQLKKSVDREGDYVKKKSFCPISWD